MNSFTSSSNEFENPGAQGLPPRREKGKTKRKSGKSVWRRSLGLIGFVFVMLLLELLVFRNLYFYGLSPGNIGQLGELKASFANAPHEQIKLGIFGDSQSMDALRPEYMAEHTPYEQNEIFNFSISGGSAYDIAQTYKQYEADLPNLEAAIVAVGEHQFNESRTVEDIKFKYYASLRDRIKVMDRDNYGELLLGWVLKSYDMRTVWTKMIEKYRDGELRKEVPVYEGGLPPVAWSPRSSRTEEYAQETADRWFDQYRIGGLRSESFESLIRALTDRGTKVIVIQLPRHEWFEQAIRSTYPDERQQYEQFLQQVTDRYGAELLIMSDDDLELEIHFRDTNHVNVEGAKIVSRQVAEGLFKNRP